MNRLADGTLPSLAKGVGRPGYDRSRTRIGFAHIGVGAFHRCHQAEYIEDALEAGADDRAEIGINLRLPSIEDQLAQQDGLYTRLLVEGDKTEARVIGSIRKVLDAERSHRAALSALSHPGIDVITMTVTEKGYCHVPATGALDWQRPEIEADLQQATGRQSLPGFLAEVLTRRMTANAPVTLVSCDNIPGNGAILKVVVSDLAEAVDRPLAGWISDNVRFPSTMVDRIVPATQAEDLKLVEQLTGVVDKGVVVGETFRQWVIEDDFNRPRPRWDVAGAEFVRDVEPYEFIKMRVLNACQTALSYLGALSGLATSYDDVCDPLLRSFAERMISDESSAVLPDVPGMQVAPYLKLSLSRLSNPAIRHTNHQIATDGSQKINQRLLQPLRDRMARGMPSPLLETAVGGWVAYLAKSQPAFGATWQANDQIMPFVADTARASSGDIGTFARLFVAKRDIFGEALANDHAFADRIAAVASGLVRDGVRKTLGATMAGTGA
ncbi:MAG: mannitol dehydrogenase family protein [Mesorhizobium sp.]|nr:mannitol dehydrogenase family protein [Mesorhizobium sp.]MBL8575744.1 mannitol dehydrogenase family protein [Mesorhizobium sp.]